MALINAYARHDRDACVLRERLFEAQDRIIRLTDMANFILEDRYAEAFGALMGKRDASRAN